MKKGSAETVRELTDKMNEAAENLEFEKAARIRDRIRAIEKIKEKQKVILSTYENQDVVSFVSDENKTAVELFVFRNSRLCDRKQYILDNYDEDYLKILQDEAPASHSHQTRFLQVHPVLLQKCQFGDF